MVDADSITGQSLSSLCSFYRCLSCNTVDNDRNRLKVGYPCPRCGKPGEGAESYFPITALALVDLIQGFFHLKGSSTTRFPLCDPEANSRLATVIFFCSLGEVLLTHLLKEIMVKQGLAKKLQERLLSDNRSIQLRVEKLYPALTNHKWKDDLERLSKGKHLNRLDTHNLFLRVAKYRNGWLHEGRQWDIPSELPRQCVQSIWPLLCLFVAFHNEHAAYDYQ